MKKTKIHKEVLNLIITGIPSILERRYDNIWKDIEVLNLIITGIPSILSRRFKDLFLTTINVLNLIITGIPSILIKVRTNVLFVELSFKPYYNWNTFNTEWINEFDFDAEF